MTWMSISISDLGRVVTGDTPPKRNPECYGDTYPFIKPTDMIVGHRYTKNYEEGYSQEGFEKYKRKLIPRGSTAVVTIGSIGQKITLTFTDCFVNQAVNVVIPDCARFDSLFVYYLLKNNLHLIKRADTGASSGRENVSKNNFSSLRIVTTDDLYLQKQIAEVLGAYDDLIETNQRRIQLLEESARLLYREWFVKLRFPGHETVPVKDGVPEGWDLKPISAMIDVNPKTPFPKDVSRPFVRMEALSENSMVIDVSEVRPISGGAKFRNGDTLLARITPCLENGKTGCVQFLEDGDAVASGSTEFIVLRSRTVNPYWLYCMARSDSFREHAINSMAGSDGRQRVNPKCFNQYLALQPPSNILQGFEDNVSGVFEQIQSLNQYNRSLKEARDMLLPRLMSGALDVSRIAVPQEVEG